MRELDLDFENSFFARGDRMTDVAELFAFASSSEQRGNRGEALQLYVWAFELLQEYPSDPDLLELRFAVETALERLRAPALRY